MLPTTSATSGSLNAWLGAIHVPWNPRAIGLPGWSIVPVVNIIGVPTARTKAATMLRLIGLSNGTYVPTNNAKARGPKRSMTPWSLVAISSIASIVGIWTSRPSGSRFKERRRRSGWW